MSTKFDIEDTLVELINNNFLLFKNDLNLSAWRILWITRPENVLRVLVSPRLGALARQYHSHSQNLIFWTSPNNYILQFSDHYDQLAPSDLTECHILRVSVQFE
jgi:nitroreductase